MVTPQPAPTNPELVRAMQTVASSDDAEARQTLYLAFLQSTLLVPINTLDDEPATGWQIVEGETQVDFVVAQDDQDNYALFAFTDEDSLHAWKSEGSRFITLSAKNLFQIALDTENIASILINVAGPVVGGELTRWEFQALANGIMPAEQGDEGAAQMTIPPGTRVAFGPLARPASAAVIATLKNALATHPEISGAHLFEMQVGDGDPQQVAGIVFADEPDQAVIERVMNALGEAITPVLSEDEFLDFMVLGDEDAPPVTLDAETRIYERAV